MPSIDTWPTMEPVGGGGITSSPHAATIGNTSTVAIARYCLSLLIPFSFGNG